MNLRALGLASLLLLDGGCRKTTAPGAEVEGLTDGGVTWAYSSVSLGAIVGPAVVVVSRQSASPRANRGNNPWVYTMVGAAADSDGVSDPHALQYVDFHPTDNQLLAYVYSLDSVQQANAKNAVDLWAVLKKGGFSYYHQQRVLLGTADFSSGANHAPMTLAPGLHLSQINTGPFNGQWALHYPDAKNATAQPWQSMCPKLMAQRPGQPAGTGAGLYGCRPVPAQSDLCGGNPTQKSCQPPPPPQSQLLAKADGTPSGEPNKTTSGLSAVAATTAVYTLTAQEAKIVFTSANLLAATDEANAAGCASQFYAVARSADRQINSSCVLKPAPGQAQNGKLACGLTLSFNQPQTYLEKICNISAVFRGATDEVQHIQVLMN